MELTVRYNNFWTVKFVQTLINFIWFFYMKKHLSVFMYWSIHNYAFVSESAKSTWNFGDPFMFKIVKEATSHSMESGEKGKVLGFLVEGTIW